MDPGVFGKTVKSGSIESKINNRANTEQWGTNIFGLDRGRD